MHAQIEKEIKIYCDDNLFLLGTSTENPYLGAFPSERK